MAINALVFERLWAKLIFRVSEYPAGAGRSDAFLARRTPAVRWIRRSDDPNRPNAMTCCFFSLKT
jgi:hypothetical protein